MAAGDLAAQGPGLLDGMDRGMVAGLRRDAEAPEPGEEFARGSRAWRPFFPFL